MGALPLFSLQSREATSRRTIAATIIRPHLAALLTIFTVPVFYLVAARLMGLRPRCGRWPWCLTNASRAGA
jgi:hypothetical protein